MADKSVSGLSVFDASGGTDLVRDMLAEMARQVMDAEVSRRCGADVHERSEERVNSRNGYRSRSWDTRAGEIRLQIPRTRTGSYFPSFLEPRRTMEKALVSVIQEAYLQGVSTRSVDDLVQALGGSGVSRSEVSRLCAEVHERVSEFLNRPLEGNFPYVWLDATYVKVRSGGRIVSKAAVIAIGMTEEGRKEVLGHKVGDAETETFWTEFVRSLRERGLKGVQLVVSDAHVGLKAAISKCLCCSWQRCRVHLMRNILSYVPRGRKEMVAAMVRTAFAQDDQESARTQWRSVSESLRSSYPSVSKLMDEAQEDALAFMAFDDSLWSKLASNNGLERLNREVKRRTDVVQIFPNDEAVVRLVGAILMEQHDEWQVCRRQASAEAITGKATKNDALLARGSGTK